MAGRDSKEQSRVREARLRAMAGNDTAIKEGEAWQQPDNRKRAAAASDNDDDELEDEDDEAPTKRTKTEYESDEGSVESVLPVNKKIDTKGTG
jgi:hypothetical protein